MFMYYIYLPSFIKGVFIPYVMFLYGKKGFDALCRFTLLQLCID